MKVIVVGAGTVGTSIASFLLREGFEVIIVDMSSERLSWVDETMDVQSIIGEVSDPKVLTQLDLPSVDVFLAVTNIDEVNLIAAFSAKKMGASKVVARVRSPHYMDEIAVKYRDPLGIDLFISPERMSSFELADFVGTAALAQATFAAGKVQMRTVRLAANSQYVKQTIMELNLPAKGILVVGIRRENEIIIPHGNTKLLPDDRVTIIGMSDIIDTATSEFDLKEPDRRLATAVIAGAGDTGLLLAQLLERRGHEVTIVESNLTRAEFVGEKLKSTNILHGDATDINLMREERFDHFDYFISVMGNDEANIMASLLAKEIGIPKTACLIDRPDYARVMERVGIDVALSPRLLTANRLMQLLKRGKSRSVTLLEEGELEIIEYVALAKSEIVGTPLKDIKLPKDCLIGAVIQESQIQIARGDTIIRPKSTVITITTPGSAEELDDLFQPAKEDTNS